VDDLGDGKPELEQCLAVCDRAHAHFGQGDGITACCPGDPQTFACVANFFGLKCSRQLFQEHGKAVGKLLDRGGSMGPLCDFVLATRDQLIAVVGQEFVH
jgi:hypothetical protein